MVSRSSNYIRMWEGNSIVFRYWTFLFFSHHRHCIVKTLPIFQPENPWAIFWSLKILVRPNHSGTISRVSLMTMNNSFAVATIECFGKNVKTAHQFESNVNDALTLAHSHHPTAGRDVIQPTSPLHSCGLHGCILSMNGHKTSIRDLYRLFEEKWVMVLTEGQRWGGE